MSTIDTPVRVVEVRCEVLVEASPETVWSTLVGDVTPWWHTSFYTSPLGPEKGGFHIEPRLGGRMYEDWGDGQGLVWATVAGIEAGRFLLLLGDMSAEWGGPSRNCTTLRLAPEGEATRLSFHASFLGRVDDGTARSLEVGWRFLLEDCLKRYVETGSLEGAGPGPEA